MKRISWWRQYRRQFLFVAQTIAYERWEETLWAPPTASEA